MKHSNPYAKGCDSNSLLPDHIAQHVHSIACAAGAGRSFYIYDPSIFATKLSELIRVLPQSVNVFYAAKANPHEAFLSCARRSGAAGIEIASLGEGERALAAGFSPEEIIFTGPGKSPEELEWSVATGIRAVHVESLTEAHRLSEICKRHSRTQDILVRVNPNFHIHGAQAQFSGDSSKMGVDEDFFRKSVREFVSLSHLNFKGLHVYAASGVLEVNDLIENCRRVFQLAADIEATNKDICCEVIDFGGGFGIDYSGAGRTFDIHDYAARLDALTREYDFTDRVFVLELGRYLAADSGWYCTEILDIKDSLGKLQVICQGGSHHLRRPVALGLNHPVSVVPMNRPAIFAGQASVRNEPVFLGGPLCNSADKLAPRDVQMDRANIGDMVVISLTGAYGLSMSHVNFLSHSLPKEFVV